MPRSGGRNDRGTSLVEYVLLVALISLVAMISLKFFGSSRDTSFDKTASTIGGIVRPFNPQL